MVLGTSSGAGKSLITTAICRLLLRRGETPVPFKGQNMSNNAWLDKNNCEMAYSQAVQAWAAGLEPTSAMNPILLKPQGDSLSEVIHLGKSMGTTTAARYYKDWFMPGWEAINKGLEDIQSSFKNSRLILEGAGSPVEINLKHRDLTNLKLAKHLNANCILVADIERGGVFAQLIGTLALLSANEKALIKGIIINRFRGDISLFDQGRKWIEEESRIPVLGIMPWLNEIFPPEDSLDLLERKAIKENVETKITVIKLPYLSNFSDLDPLEAEPNIRLTWVKPGDFLGNPDAIIIPGSKQTLKDLEKIQSSGLGDQIKKYALSGGIIFGICGGLQILGRTLEDPHCLEQTYKDNYKYKFEGLNLLPIKTIFEPKKTLSTKNILAYWPNQSTISGFEIHHGISEPIDSERKEISSLCEESSLGWVSNNQSQLNIAGTYLHGIFENGEWRRMWINRIRIKQNLKELPLINENHTAKREKLINRLTDAFEKHINLEPVLKE
ncbi:cobyric acid synthase [Prochlorococcus marinus]|uniref:cobyric acid synthase n=1 Tax=Prochlorococcus marinus TaxID=1219 RepID=UPI0022B5B18D|nr:cobyric acid synthase [Prochlorococcus marinus]